MNYVRRKEAPSYTDKWWIKTTYGGYNHCILINSSTGSVLPNCFIGETEFITDKGIKKLIDCVDQEVNVLSIGGVYRKATVKYFGVQDIYAFPVGGETFYTTENHRWLVNRTDRFGHIKEQLVTTTCKMKSHYHIPYEKAPTIEEFSEDGIRHGFIFGDGSFYNGKRHSLANLCGAKKDYMKEFFSDAIHHRIDKNGTETYYPYPKEYRSLPSIDSDLPYLKGFLIGYLASDGCVDKKGCVTISSAKRESLEFVRDICAKIGIRTFKVTCDYRKGFNDYETPLYRVAFCRSDLTPDMLLNPEHKRRFQNNPVQKECKMSKPGKAVYTGYQKDVYCVVEPETETFVLGNGILTKNCVAAIHGRWGELAESIWGLEEAKKIESRLCLNNAENYWAYTKDGFSRGQEPKLGAIIVWQKGATTGGSDGAGHVAIVEAINKDANGNIVSIETSASNYGGTRWYTSTYKKSNNYYIGSSYKFLGFIYFPYDFESGIPQDEPCIVSCGYASPGDLSRFAKAIEEMGLKPEFPTDGYVRTPVRISRGDQQVLVNIGIDTGVPVVKYEKSTIGTPVTKDSSVDQVEITISNLNGRKSASGTKWGKYITPGYYNVLCTDVKTDYTWYQVESDVEGTKESLWCAKVDGVNFIKATTPPTPTEPSDWERRYNELLASYTQLEQDYNDAVNKLNDALAENTLLNSKIATIKQIINA